MYIQCRTYAVKHIFEKMPHLSDLRDELEEQKDEGLMAYVKESIVVDEEELTRLNVARLIKKY